MASASARKGELEVTFEVYVRRDGRWLIVDVVHDRASALKLGRQLAAQKEHEAVKIVREELDPGTGNATELVVFDSEIRIAPPVGAAARPEVVPRPRKPEPEVRRPAAEPERRSFPWLALTSTVLGLSFAVLGFWFIDAIY